MSMQSERMVGYFSMEIALEAGLPTYSGGLGVLAGDTIRSAADLKVPMVAITGQVKTFAVGKDIVPGVYISAGPLPGDACYWRRIGAAVRSYEFKGDQIPAQHDIIDPSQVHARIDVIYPVLIDLIEH